MVAVALTVEVDWNNDQDFADTGEDVSNRVRSQPGVRTVRGLDTTRGVKPPRSGTFDAELGNQSKDYSTEYGTSPLVGLLEPGRMVRCRMTVDGATVHVFRGPLDDLPQHPEPLRLSVGIPALGMMSRIAGKTGYSTPLYGDGTEAGGVRSDIALHRLLDALGETTTDAAGTLGAAIADTTTTSVTMTAGHTVEVGGLLLIDSERLYVSAVVGNALTVVRGFLGSTTETHLNGATVAAYRRIFDVGQTTFLYWWLDKSEEGHAAALAILNSEGPGAALFEDGQGRIVFKNRFHRVVDSVSTVVQATYRDTGTEPRYSLPFKYDRGLKRVVNACTVTHVKRALYDLDRIWDPGADDVVLSVNEVRTYTVVDAGGDPFTAAVVPVLNRDYKVVSGGSVASMTLDRTSGTSCVLTITAGAAGATIRNLELRAQAVRVTATTKLVNTTTATASIAAYGPQPYTLQTRGEVGINALQSLCDAVVALWQNPRPAATVTIENVNATRVSEFVRDVGHRINVVNAQTGLATDMHVDQIGFEFGMFKGGNAGRVRMTLDAEKVTDSTRYFIIGTDTLGGTAVLGY